MSVVTVAIPVLNGERYLGEVLAAVREQEVDRELELLVVDSGSTDASLEIAREHGAEVHSIPRASFSHGATRNWMVELARGEHVAFLTQDATPAHARWLRALLDGFAAADDVGLVFGPHRPRPGASHMIKAEMWRFFRSWGEDGIDVQRVDTADEADVAAYRREAWRRQYFSDVNGCVARQAWEQVPYRPVPYAEDQLLGREMVEAGWAKAFNPEAEVLHSHHYPPGDFLRRYFDEYRSLREVLGHVEPLGPRRSARDVWHLVKADRAYLREVEGLSKPASLGPLAVSARHHALRTAGAVLGTRADRLPRRARAALSLEGRDTFEPVAIPGSPLAEGGQLARGQSARPLEPADPGWDYGFVRDAFPRRPLTLEPARDLAGKESLELAWILPPWKRGSGGHTTIFRIIRMLEERGHRCSIRVFDPMHRDHRPAHELAAEVRDHFIPLDAPIVRGLDGWGGGDVGIATNWWTAYPLRDLPHCAEKVYLVQDIEPEFHARSAEYLWAEETYRMDYRCIAYTPWMANILRERYGLWAEHFECGTDLLTYRPGREDTRETATVAVYARLETERRAVELALAALQVVKERRPDVHVVTFGSERRLRAPFEHENLGVTRPATLAALYQRATVGLCFSLTTHSLVAQEMMAGGLPVVELEGENVSSQLGASGEHVVQAAPDPVSVAEAVLSLLDDDAGRRAMASRARKFVEGRTWDRAGDQVETALRKFLASPRDGGAS